MGAAVRRPEMLKYLCKARKSTMPQLSEMFGVSLRTIQRDIYEIEATFHVPLEIKCGKYDGGVYVIGDYIFDRAYMCDEEIMLLTQIHSMVSHKLSKKENRLFSQIIKKYTKIA